MLSETTTHVTFPSIQDSVDETAPSPAQLAVKRAKAARSNMRHSERYSISLHDQLFRDRRSRSTLTATVDSKRPSAVSEPKLAPTYQLEPKKKFHRNRVQPIIEETLKEELAQARYVDASTAGRRSCILAEVLKEKVKALQLDRYKIVATVSIGSKADLPPAAVFASQGLWSQSTDGFASAAFENDSLFAVAVVYAVYAE